MLVQHVERVTIGRGIAQDLHQVVPALSLPVEIDQSQVGVFVRLPLEQFLVDRFGLVVLMRGKCSAGQGLPHVAVLGFGRDDRFQTLDDLVLLPKFVQQPHQHLVGSDARRRAVLVQIRLQVVERLLRLLLRLGDTSQMVGVTCLARLHRVQPLISCLRVVRAISREERFGH